MSPAHVEITRWDQFWHHQCRTDPVPILLKVPAFFRIQGFLQHEPFPSSSYCGSLCVCPQCRSFPSGPPPSVSSHQCSLRTAESQPASLSQAKGKRLYQCVSPNFSVTCVASTTWFYHWVDSSTWLLLLQPYPLQKKPLGTPKPKRHSQRYFPSKQVYLQRH